jgi:nucleoside-diphosphate-sugar epimerase
LFGKIHALVGGLGFVGLHLAEVLISLEIQPVIIARKSTVEKKAELARYVKKKSIDLITITNGIRNVLLQLNPESIYHLAGKAGGSKSSQYQAHVALLEEEIDAAKSIGSKIIYFSSIAVSADLANKPRNSTIYEPDVPPGSQSKFATIHSETKALGESILVESGLKDWTILRPGLIFGPRALHTEWKLLKSFVSMNIKISINNVPVVNVIDVASIAAESGLGEYNRKWLHLVADTIELTDVLTEMCLTRGKKKCLNIPVNWLVNLSFLPPRRSSARLLWNIISKSYKFRSIYLKNYKWRLSPVD